MRGELARYDTYSAGLEHLNTLQHAQTHAESQQDTVALARALQVTTNTKYDTVILPNQEY